MSKEVLYLNEISEEFQTEYRDPYYDFLREVKDHIESIRDVIMAHCEQIKPIDLEKVLDLNEEEDKSSRINSFDEYMEIYRKTLPPEVEDSDFELLRSTVEKNLSTEMEDCCKLINPENSTKWYVAISSEKSYDPTRIKIAVEIADSDFNNLSLFEADGYNATMYDELTKRYQRKFEPRKADENDIQTRTDNSRFVEFWHLRHLYSLVKEFVDKLNLPKLEYGRFLVLQNAPRMFSVYPDEFIAKLTKKENKKC